MTDVRVYSVEEAARELKISRSKAWELVWAGTLRSIKLGHRVLVPAAALQELIDTAESASKVAVS